MEQMLRQVTFRGNIQLQYRPEFSADVLKELHQMLPTTTCRILPISTWPKLTILFLLVGQFQ